MGNNIKLCIVGDVHAVQNELDECKLLIDKIDEECSNNECNVIVFMGDLFHTFSIINSYVLNFWNDTFERLRKKYLVIVIKGNHDSPGAGLDTNEHGLQVFKGTARFGNLAIIDKPTTYDNWGIQFIPHFYDNTTFINSVDPTIATIYCHQEFNGAQYENGLYTSHGVDVSKLPQNVQIVSGHIHKHQSFANIWYVGSPRWRSVSDANETKGFWIVEHDLIGTIKQKQFFDTSKVCKPIHVLHDSPSFTIEQFPTWGTVYVDLHGPRDYVEKRKKELSGRGFKIRPFPETENIKVKESEGFPVAFNKYLDSFVPKNGTDKEVLRKISQERISWLKKNR